jgi:hypothetical protein
LVIKFLCTFNRMLNKKICSKKSLNVKCSCFHFSGNLCVFFTRTWISQHEIVHYRASIKFVLWQGQKWHLNIRINCLTNLNIFQRLKFWLLFEYIFDKFSLTKQSCFLKICLKILAMHWFLNLLLDIKIFVVSSAGFRIKCNKEVLTKQPMFPKNKNWFRKCWKSLRLASFHPSTCMTQLFLNKSFNNEIEEKA